MYLEKKREVKGKENEEEWEGEERRDEAGTKEGKR